MALRTRGFRTAEIGGLLLFALLSTAALWFLPPSSRPDRTRLKLRALLPIPNGEYAGYTTNFSIAEDPISEGGNISYTWKHAADMACLRGRRGFETCLHVSETG